MAKRKKNQRKKKTQPPKPRIRQLAHSLYTLAHDLPVHGEWLDDVEIEKIENDPTILSAIAKRKAATLKKSLKIHSSNDTFVATLEEIIDHTFRSQVLDTVYQGMSLFELNWEEREGYYYPIPVERDYRAFSLLDGKLIYEFEEVDPRKVLHLTYRAKFSSQLGRGLYDTLFWLRRFKASSMEFWLEFMERFGKPWVIGKTDADKNAMAQELYAMLGGDVAVIEQEDTIDLATPNEKGGFKELLLYLDDQIREAITGGNLTGNVKEGSYAATQTHKLISDEISMADEKLLSEAITKLIEQFRTLNHITAPITFTLEDTSNPNTDLATRDKTLGELMGDRFVFTEAYLTQTYGIDIEAAPKTLPAKRPFAMSAKPLPEDEIDRATNAIETEHTEEKILQALQEAFANATSYEEAYESLTSALSTLDEALLLQAFEKYLSNAMLYGNIEAGTEDA